MVERNGKTVLARVTKAEKTTVNYYEYNSIFFPSDKIDFEMYDKGYNPFEKIKRR